MSEKSPTGQEPKKVVALYARVSTLDQNCEVQIEDLRRYASKRFANHYEYTDAGVSGTQRHRPQLDTLMRDARKRSFDVVLEIAQALNVPVSRVRRALLRLPAKTV